MSTADVKSIVYAASEAVHDARLVVIVGRHLKFHGISNDETDETFSHFAGNVSENLVAVFEFDPEHRSGEDGRDVSFDLDGLFLFRSALVFGAWLFTATVKTASATSAATATSS